MGRREDPRFHHCYLNFVSDHRRRVNRHTEIVATAAERERKARDPLWMTRVCTEDDRAATERRRRIEDIREAARLEREVLNEVWDP